jgi:hypothetical protein
VTPASEGNHVDLVSTTQFVRTLRVQSADLPLLAYIKELTVEEEEATPMFTTPRDPDLQKHEETVLQEFADVLRPDVPPGLPPARKLRDGDPWSTHSL